MHSRHESAESTDLERHLGPPKQRDFEKHRPAMTDRLHEYDIIWRRKPVLRAIYQDCYRMIVSRLRPGGTLEIGGGVGNLKAYSPGIVSLDIQFASWLDVVADAHRIPFSSGSFDNIVMFDVLHHLENPRWFLIEARRILRSGGRLIVCEPAITPISYLFYKLFHPEPVRIGEDPLTDHGPPKGRDPYQANQAIPTRLFVWDRSRLEQAVPGFRVGEVKLFSLLAYPLSGGFRSWSMLPVSFVNPLLRWEERLLPFLGRVAAFRLLGVIEAEELPSEIRNP